MALVGKKAPLFKAKAVVEGQTIVNSFDLSDYIGQKYVVLFFYPKDFTFVCPTELFAFEEKLGEFEKLDTAVIACSTDTEHSHWGWLQMDKNAGGIKGVTYPIVADTNKTISSNYDVLNGDWCYDEDGKLSADSELIAYRGLFIIDLNGVVRHQLINDLPLGRSVDEALRMVEAIQFNDKNGEVCPANWTNQKEGLIATHEGIAEYLSRN